MACSKALSTERTKSIHYPEFTEELLPVSKKIPLLYHISYLCLAKFPTLERLLRKRAVETQLLFGYSEALLLKCQGTSANLVSSLFPMLIFAIEGNDKEMAIHYLTNAKNWITEITEDVKKMVQRYSEHNKDVASTTSDIIAEKVNTESKSAKLSQDIQAIENSIKTLDDKLSKVKKEIEESQQMIDATTQELEKCVQEITKKNSGLNFFANVVPFIGPIVKLIYNSVTPSDAQKTKHFEIKLNELTSKRSDLKKKEWQIDLQKIDYQMNLDKQNTDLGIIPNPVHLKEVQTYLTKVQEILISINIFWEKVLQLLKTMHQKTFNDEILVKRPELKDMFVTSIKNASESWQTFGDSCIKAAEIFKQQSKDAYAFLEIDPSSLTEAAWQEEYNNVMAQLQEIDVLDQDPAAIEN